MVKSWISDLLVWLVCVSSLDSLVQESKFRFDLTMLLVNCYNVPLVWAILVGLHDTRANRPHSIMAAHVN